jgi:predicted SAM-dependent methyltransferase
MYILNIAAGKVLPIRPLKKDDTLINLDLTYFNPTKVEYLESHHRNHDLGDEIQTKPLITYCNHDVYNFLENYTQQFDMVIMYRFLEHVPKVKLLYFLYILSTVVKIGGTVEVIVPDYKLLAKRILNENVQDIDFEAQDIITTFELLNEPYCPHASVWTSDRAKHFFELEERFKIVEINENYPFDGRDIYLRFVAERIK